MFAYMNQKVIGKQNIQKVLETVRISHREFVTLVIWDLSQTEGTQGSEAAPVQLDDHEEEVTHNSRSRANWQKGGTDILSSLAKPSTNHLAWELGKCSWEGLPPCDAEQPTGKERLIWGQTDERAGSLAPYGRRAALSPYLTGCRLV